MGTGSRAMAALALALAATGAEAGGSRPAQAQQRPAPPAAPTPAQGQAPAAPAQPAAPVRTEILNHDSWTVSCQDFADKRRVCNAALQIVQTANNQNQVLLTWRIGMDDQNRLVSVFQTLTGVTLAPGLDIKFGKGATRKATYVSCEPNACVATAPMDDAFVRDLLASESAEALMYASNGRGLQFNIPLKGADKALAAVRRP